MMIAEALLVFTITWWVALFVSLPVKVEMHAADEYSVGCDSGAPKKTYLLVKVLIVTAGAALITGLYCYFKHTGYVDRVFAILFEIAP